MIRLAVSLVVITVKTFVGSPVARSIPIWGGYVTTLWHADVGDFVLGTGATIREYGSTSHSHLTRGRGKTRRCLGVCGGRRDRRLGLRKALDRIPRPERDDSANSASKGMGQRSSPTSST